MQHHPLMPAHRAWPLVPGDAGAASLLHFSETCRSHVTNHSLLILPSVMPGKFWHICLTECRPLMGCTFRQQTKQIVGDPFSCTS